ncbi:MAG: SDR family NAD(P)-dependent oxidoreductase [Alphaproteobacteria bacterium]|nr:SDR family NAD(P)-dependent oxidoreductase [Alphaproteobacteria bacterium]|tara:strand:+ start:1006 stop:1719 length:714 start_codon:yes stop_codon:yes gene_type:complete
MSAVVFGASGGIGQAIVRRLLECSWYNPVFAVSRSGRVPEGAINIQADALDESALEAVAKEISTKTDRIKLCVVAVGLLHEGDGLTPEKSYRHQSRDAFERVFAANTIGPALIAKHMLGRMPQSGRWVFAALSARVGSIGDNGLGGWHAYRASKAALNMLIRNYSIECQRRNSDAICVGLHPGTVDTGLSLPFQSNVPDSQLFSPDQSAAYLLEVIDNLTAADSGKVLDWAGKTVPA